MDLRKKIINIIIVYKVYFLFWNLFMFFLYFFFSFFIFIIGNYYKNKIIIILPTEILNIILN